MYLFLVLNLLVLTLAGQIAAYSKDRNSTDHASDAEEAERVMQDPAPSNFNPYDPYSRPQPQARQGDLCTAPKGYMAKACDVLETLETISIPASRLDYGPNVCRVTRRANVTELGYSLKRQCIWVFSHVYYQYIKRCSLECLPTSKCTNVTREDETIQLECCEGYETAPYQEMDPQTYFYDQYFKRPFQEPTGCPLSNGCTLLECIEKQERLSQFVALLNRSLEVQTMNQSSLIELLDDSDSMLTVFAPTNEAFDAISDQLAGLTDEMVVELLLDHIVNGSVVEDDLIEHSVFETLAGTKLRGSQIDFNDNSYYNYRPDGTGGTRVYSENFIEGAQIVVENACRLRRQLCSEFHEGETVVQSGHLHIIDRVLMPSNFTIAEIISNDTRFSILRDVLEVIGILQYLEKTDRQRTLFAPTDEAFMSALSPQLIMCLSVFMRRPLNNILLFHIAEGLKYQSVLSLRDSVFTMLQQYLQVSIDQDCSVMLGEDMVRIAEADILASNGVIQVLNGVLIPPNIDYGTCEGFVMEGST